MDASDWLVRVLVSRAARLEQVSEVDRHDVPVIGGVREVTTRLTPPTPANPKDAMLRQIGAMVASTAGATGDQVLDAVLNGTYLTTIELRELLRRPGLTTKQRSRILRHDLAPGDAIIEFVCDSRHESGMFTVESLHEQVELLQRATGITGHQRLTAWSTLVLRAARAALTQDHIGDVLIASPGASAVLHASIESTLATTRNIPPALHRHILSHLCAPATLAIVPLGLLDRIVERARVDGSSVDRTLDTICDLVAATCRIDPQRWAQLFALARRWERSIGELLDAVEHPQATPEVLRARRRSAPLTRDRHVTATKPLGSSSAPVA